MPHISTTMRTPNKVETYFREKLPSLNNRLPLHDINHQCHTFSLARFPTRICSDPSHPLNSQTRQHIMPLPTMIACPADNCCHCSAIQEIIKKEFIGLGNTTWSKMLIRLSRIGKSLVSVLLERGGKPDCYGTIHLVADTPEKRGHN